MPKVVSPAEKRFRKAFGENLRRIRQSKKLTLVDMEDITSIHYNQLARIERGDVTTSIYAITVISKALKIHPKQLFELDP
jgi:transcriptional regulator with XRE-family HTH domain